MALHTDHLRRCIQTLQLSLEHYQKAPQGSVEQEVFRNALVKAYELSQETAFKLVKKALKLYEHTSKILDQTPIKPLLRMAATHGLMTLEEVERWFEYRDNRNNTAHDYGEGFARETLRLIPQFIQDVTHLEKVLSERLGAVDV